jgi:bacterioferritin (cytochrome b1)
MRPKFFVVLILVFLSAVPSLAQSGGGNQSSKQITPKDAIDKQKQREREQDEQLKAREEHHKKIQDKATRKRMKKNLKKAEKQSWGKNIPWYKRWFRKKKFKS